MSSLKTIKEDNLLTALVSGTTAAGVAATITYPFDFIKTQQQLNNGTSLKKWNITGNYPSSLGQLYKGGSALVIGSLLKNSTRIISYNWLSDFMASETHDANGNIRKSISAPRIVIAGMISGFIETLWLIPFENIKITMVQNMSLHNELLRNSDLKYDLTGTTNVNKHHKPTQNIFTKQFVSPHAYFTSELIAQFKGKSFSRFHHRPDLAQRAKIDLMKAVYNKHPTLTFFGSIKEMYALKGINAFTAGTFITFVRQAGISTVWFWTYNATRQLLDPHNTEQSWFGHKHTAFQLIGLHLLSSIAVVAATQPLDVIKTHIQSKNGKAIYKDSLTTAYRLFLDQGPRAMFKGSLPRGIKVLVNGGLTAAIYSYVEDVVTVAGGKTIFAPE